MSLSSQPRGHVIIHQARARDRNFMRLPWVDTAGPAGRMLMQMLGSFAEFERAMVRERTRAGLKAAAARGRKGGRQPKLTPEQKAEILDGLGSGRKSAADLARLFRVHRATISRLAAQARVAAPVEA